MFKKKNILKHCVELDFYPNITQAKKSIPDWYKAGISVLPEDKDHKIFEQQKGFKSCMPFFESFNAGYMLPLIKDISILQTDGGPSITYSDVGHSPIVLRNNVSGLNKTLPVPSGFSELHFAWETKNGIKIPKGYSFLFTHPLNRYDLPFLTFSGIVDGQYFMAGGNVPVLISNTFEGTIPAGTPIAQIIPFKTESWDSELDQSILQDCLKARNTSVTRTNWYKKNFWVKKHYN
jgi:hypothetical protein